MNWISNPVLNISSLINCFYLQPDTLYSDCCVVRIIKDIYTYLASKNFALTVKEKFQSSVMYICIIPVTISKNTLLKNRGKSLQLDFRRKSKVMSNHCIRKELAYFISCSDKIKPIFSWKWLTHNGGNSVKYVLYGIIQAPNWLLNSGFHFSPGWV